jgi:hypothetical protein
MDSASTFLGDLTAGAGAVGSSIIEFEQVYATGWLISEQASALTDKSDARFYVSSVAVASKGYGAPRTNPKTQVTSSILI